MFFQGCLGSYPEWPDIDNLKLGGCFYFASGQDFLVLIFALERKSLMPMTFLSKQGYVRNRVNVLWFFQILYVFVCISISIKIMFNSTTRGFRRVQTHFIYKKLSFFAKMIFNVLYNLQKATVAMDGTFRVICFSTLGRTPGPARSANLGTGPM